MKSLTLYQVDAFTDQLFGGNPAGVVGLEAWLPDDVLQNIAAENNLSETAFYVPKDDGYELRWFTPDYEVDLCGHATLATAWVLYRLEGYKQPRVKFFTQSGTLGASSVEGLVTIDLPSRVPVPVPAPEALRNGLNLKVTTVLKSRDYLVVLDSEEEVKHIKPDFEELNKLDVLGVIVTAPGNDCDFVSRFFQPNTLSLEDPVTGSAHCSLAPYWADRLGKKSLHARQLSKRGGELICNVADTRVYISGKAVLYMKGSFFI